jgi:D-alanyl-D-alanine dipeptidase
MHVRALALAAMLAAPAACQPAGTPAPAPEDGARQMIVVTTAGWNAVDATLQRYERDGEGEAWRPVGGAIRAAVGRTGLAWGDGIHPDPGIDGPRKREGDGRAPAGIYRLSSAFGYASAAEAGWIRIPYVQSTPSIECVDDSRTRFYNRRVDRDTIPQPDWNSHEEMLRPDALYRWGVWVDHNSDPPRPLHGSCIFLHVWAGPGVATSGCTAMAESDLRALLAWLDPRARPVLAQLPAAAYDGLRGAWKLP